MANYLPAMYQPTYTYPTTPTYPQTQPANTHGDHGIKWVDGEVGAKAYQMPASWPANIPIALWDTNDTVIYLKSINPMGMPNPLQKARYVLEEYKSASPMKADDTEPAHETVEYVRMEDLERMKNDLIDAISGMTTTKKQPAKEE